MQNNNCKNRNTQLPGQVVAVNEFQKLIGAYFEMNSLSEVNRILTEMLSASTGPDPRSGKHHPITIANTLYKVNNIINLFTKAKPLANKASFRHSLKNQPYNLQAVGHFNIAQLSELLHYGLSSFIFQEEGFEGATLNFSAEIIPAYKMIYDWLADCDTWYTAFKQRIQIN